MKKHLFAFLFALILLLCLGAAAYAENVPIDTAHFPDVNFRSYVSTNCDTNGDGALSSAEIAGVKTIQVKESQISSLEGIEVFTALEELDCSKNRLNSLDISALSGLKNLNCSRTPLTTLDVTHCPELKVLKCSTCALSELDISNCPKLFWLEAPWNNLSALDLSSNPALKFLIVTGNLIPVLDISACPILVETVNVGPYEENGDECWYGVYEGEPNSRMVDFGKATLLKTSAEQKVGILYLPAALTRIEAEAFAGTAADIVYLPQGCETVESGAFAASPKLKIVHAPAATQIAADAFDSGVYLDRVG